MIYPLVVLSYHRFNETPSNYDWSRTYNQFKNDLDTKIFDWIVMDDGYRSQLKALNMMKERNLRAKIAIVTSWINSDHQPEVITSKELVELSKYHDIVNHTHNHIDLTTLDEEAIRYEIDTANKMFSSVGLKSRFFVPPYNEINDDVERIVKNMGLILLKNRINISNKDN
jgi:peptidoglycan/xylan/chitin deacetylase (PgdA/CDA1 family)